MAEKSVAGDTFRRSGVWRYVGYLAAFSGYTSSVLIIAATVVICYGVLLRYILGASTVWQTELSIYFLIYATFVGASYGLQHGDHVRINLVIDRLGPRARRFVEAGTRLLAFCLVAVVAVVSADLWWDAVETDKRSGTAWNPPMAIPYAIVPLGSLILALQFLVYGLEEVRKFRTKEDVVAEDDTEPPETQPA